MSDEDPEVAADIALRNRTARERARSDGATWHPAKIVDKWPCRACKVLCDISSEAMDGYQAFNRMLAAKGDARLDFQAIMFCDACRIVYVATAADRRRGQTERMRPVVAALKRSGNPEQEHEAIKQLQAWGHPDVQGLIASIRARIDGKRGLRPPGDV